MMNQYESDIDSQNDVLTEPEQAQIPLFHVVMYNDNFTTMDFVVFVLVRVFAHGTDKAMALMMEVHHKGWAVVATLPKEIGEMKIAAVQEYAEQAEFPLLLTLQRA
ncbi:ATP-dependent Clp protease adaptor ClpS [Moraxella nonliquefaciens]|nr:ATP-dependent Clp protease adaptor ClpS [Moraxella nonliquefaciens]MDI4497305.1 ATP-dependent Clp protease adaptor ClpS [Moraxella nonliquefaciens]MDI4499240.1 ATP-dependent Clp protease adaptor ClpS [Moraxella nonliquefaciens]